MYYVYRDEFNDAVLMHDTSRQESRNIIRALCLDSGFLGESMVCRCLEVWY